MNNNKSLMGTTWSPILQCADDSVQLTSGNFTHVSNRDIVKVDTLVLWERILLSNKKLLPSKIWNAAPKVRITRELIILSACLVNGSASRFKMLKPLWTRCNETLLEECLSLTIPEKKSISENFPGTNPNEPQQGTEDCKTRGNQRNIFGFRNREPHDRGSRFVNGFRILRLKSLHYNHKLRRNIPRK